jgi:hypothetical protein
MLALAAAKPGGHIGYGGVYPVLDQNADYIPHAKNAAKLAAQIAFEEDESLVGLDAERPARSVDALDRCKGPVNKGLYIIGDLFTIFQASVGLRADLLHLGAAAKRGGGVAESPPAAEDQQADAAGQAAPLLQRLQGAQPADRLPVTFTSSTSNMHHMMNGPRIVIY